MTGNPKLPDSAAQNLATASSLDRLDVPGLRALRASQDEQLRVLDVSLAEADLRARGAFESQDLPSIEQGWTVHAELDRRRSELIGQRDGVDAALQVKLRPLAAECRVRADATVRDWRSSKASAVGTIDDAITNLEQESNRLENLPAHMREERQNLEAQHADLVGESLAVDWRVPSVTEDLWQLTQRLRNVTIRVGRLARDST